MADMSELGALIGGMTQAQPVSAFMQGRAMQVAFERDKMQNQMMEMQLQMYPQILQHNMEMQKLDMLGKVAGINKDSAEAGKFSREANAPIFKDVAPGNSLYAFNPDGSPMQSGAAPATGAVGAAAFGGTQPGPQGPPPPQAGGAPSAGGMAGPQPLVAAQPKLHLESRFSGGNETQYQVDEFGTIHGGPVGAGPRAAGQAYDPSTVDITANGIASGKLPALSGFTMKTPWGQAVMAKVLEIKPDYSYGDAPAQAATLKAFTSGKEGRTVRSLNVAMNHLDVMTGAADALQNGNIQAINKLGNWFQTETGQTAPTNFRALKDIVATEVVKAITAAGGGVTDRKDAQTILDEAKSPDQLKGSIRQIKALFSGQLQGLQQQYEQGTGKKDFGRFLSGSSQQLATPTTSSHPPDIQNLLNKYGSGGG